MMACHFSFNLIDSIWVGRLIGPAALAAVSTAGFYTWVLLSLGEMVEVGLIALAARRHGEGSPEPAARAAAAALAYALLAGSVVSAVGMLFGPSLFRLMTVPPEVAVLGKAYLSTWLLGGPLVFGFFAIEATFRASGDPRTPFLLLLTSVALSILLDPLLIAGLGPFPRLGVEGAAVASVMVRGGGCLIGVAIALRRGLIRLSAPDWRAIPTIMRIGAPISLNGVLFSLIYMWLTRFTSRFGTSALAALGIGHKVEGLGFIAISGFALSAGALVGQNLGAGLEDRARDAVRLTVRYCLLVTVTTAVIFLLVPRTLAGLFTTDPRSEEHTSELQSPVHLVCRLLLEKKNKHKVPLGLAAPRRIQRRCPDLHRGARPLVAAGPGRRRSAGDGRHDVPEHLCAGRPGRSY